MHRTAGDVAVDADVSLVATMPDADGGPFLSRASVKWLMLQRCRLASCVAAGCHTDPHDSHAVQVGTELQSCDRVMTATIRQRGSETVRQERCWAHFPQLLRSPADTCSTITAPRPSFHAQTRLELHDEPPKELHGLCANTRIAIQHAQPSAPSDSADQVCETALIACCYANNMAK
jgi:hypothetical protein